MSHPRRLPTGFPRSDAARCPYNDGVDLACNLELAIDRLPFEL